MHRPHAMRRPRLLVAALAGLLVVPLTAWQGSPAEADGPPMTTTQITGPPSATAGQPTTLTASVTPGVAGTVLFIVDEVPLPGPEAPVTNGAASAPFTFPSPGLSTVVAIFHPTDHGLSASEDSQEVQVAAAAEPLPTTTTVTGPTSATVGTPAALAATVTPALAAGTVQFSVDGSLVGSPVTVAAGEASMSHTFADAGTKTVRATFTPADSDAYFGSADSAGLVVSVDSAPTTTVVTGPDNAVVGTPATLAAVVSPASAVGTIQFSVDGSPVGAPVPVTDGAASVSHTFASGGVASVRATFEPTDVDAYTSSVSTDHVVDIEPGATTTEITGPDTAKVGDETTLSATVLPAEATGTVTFYVDGTPVATAGVDAGAASALYTYESEGRSDLVALFESAEAGAYRSSTSTVRTLDVEPGPTSESTTEPVSTTDVTTETECPTGGRTAAGATDQGGVTSRADPIQDFIFGVVLGISPLVYNGLTFISTTFSQVAYFVAAAFKIGPYVDPCGGGRHRVAETVTGTVQCVLTEAGYACPIDFPADAKLTITAAVPIPADLAGRRVKLVSTVSSVDPQTGALTTLGSDQTITRVPKRTVLSARLAPLKSGVTSVKRGKSVAYRVVVRNAGIVTADRVRTCVSLGKGAEILVAKHADIRRRQACWTLPSLKKGQTAVRSLTLRAPPHSGPLRIVATVTPKKTQADPVRLIGLLDVR